MATDLFPGSPSKVYLTSTKPGQSDIGTLPQAWAREEDAHEFAASGLVVAVPLLPKATRVITIPVVAMAVSLGVDNTAYSPLVMQHSIYTDGGSIDPAWCEFDSNAEFIVARALSLPILLEALGNKLVSDGEVITRAHHDIAPMLLATISGVVADGFEVMGDEADGFSPLQWEAP